MKSARLILVLLASFLAPLTASAAKPLLPEMPVTGFNSPEDYTVLRGKVTVGTINEHLIGVVVDETLEAGQTAQYHHLFRLQTVQSIQPFRVVSESASVEFRGDELVILAADRDLFYVLMLPEAEPNTPRKVTARATRYFGFGLNHEIRPVRASAGSHRGIVALDVVDCDIDDCFFNEDYGSIGGAGSCTAGGGNATSCMTGNSYGACSISCSGHSYACCTAATASNNAYCSCLSTP